MRFNDQDRSVDLPGDRSGNVDGRALPEIINVRLVSETQASDGWIIDVVGHGLYRFDDEARFAVVDAPRRLNER